MRGFSLREDCRRFLELSILKGENHRPLASSQIHAKLVTSGLQRDSFLCTKLISLYCLRGLTDSAEKILHGLNHDRDHEDDDDHHHLHLNSFLLSALIRGLTSNGLHRRAVSIFYEKTRAGKHLCLSPSAFSSAAKACAASPDFRRGRPLHGLSVTSGLISDLFLRNSLVGMYFKCGNLRDALQMFDGMPQRDTVSWNSVISALAHHGMHREALQKISEMIIHGGLLPDQVTLITALTASCFLWKTVKELHGYAIKSELLFRESTVQNALISAYARCGRVREARIIFKTSTILDGVSWNAMISGYAKNGFFEESFLLLEEMETLGIKADVVTYSGIVSSLAQSGRAEEAIKVFRHLLRSSLLPDAIAVASALSAVSDLRRCREIHGFCVRKGLEFDRRVENALVSAYGQCGLTDGAWKVFNEMGSRDVISWSAMVAGFVQNGMSEKGLELFREMIRGEVEPNPISVTSVLAACADVSGLRQGRELHLWAVKENFDIHTFVGSALIDMYAKCGRVEDARKLFDRIPEKNLVTWNAMIGGYAFHGLGEEALKIFRDLRNPDEVSFIAVLSACSHGGMVEQGVEIFNSMEKSHVSPKEGHYACMVDILGRSGRLGEAMEMVRSMPMEPSKSIWGSLLLACRIHCNFRLGVFSGAQIVFNDGNEESLSGYYVMVSNLMAESGLWKEVELTRKLMSERGVKKTAGCSWIEVNKKVHSFLAKDREQHPDWGSLLETLIFLNEQMSSV